MSVIAEYDIEVCMTEQDKLHREWVELKASADLMAARAEVAAWTWRQYKKDDEPNLERIDLQGFERGVCGTFWIYSLILIFVIFVVSYTGMITWNIHVGKK